MIRAFFLPRSATSTRDAIDRWIQFVVALAIMGVALGFLVRAHIGVAPWDVLTLGIMNFTGLGFGVVSVMISLVVLVLWIPLRQRLGAGTIVNGVLIGIFTDIAMRFIPEVQEYWIRGIYFGGGMIVIAFATVLYIGADIGTGPRDGLMTGLARVTGYPIGVVRTALELTVLLVGWALAGWTFGSPVGVGTILFALGIGPLVQVFLSPVVRWRQRRSERLAVAV